MSCTVAVGGDSGSKQNNDCVRVSPQAGADAAGWDVEEDVVLAALLDESGQRKSAGSCHGFDVQPECNAADVAAALGVPVKEHVQFKARHIVDALDRLERPLLFRGCAEMLWPGREQLGRRSLRSGPFAKHQVWAGKISILRSLIGDWPFASDAEGTKQLALREYLRGNLSGSIFDTGTQLRELGEKLIKAAVGKKWLKGTVQDHPLMTLFVGLPAVRPPGPPTTPATEKGFPDPVVSLSARGEGASLHYHGHAMLGLMSGRKLWLVGPYNGKQLDHALGWAHWATRKNWPSVVNLTGNGNWSLCIQEPGDVAIVPTRWWHGTANLKEGLGLGRQSMDDHAGDYPQHWSIRDAAKLQPHFIGMWLQMLDMEFLKPEVDYKGVLKGLKQLRREVIQAMKHGIVDATFAKVVLAHLISNTLLPQAEERKLDFFMNTEKGLEFTVKWWEAIWKIDPAYDPFDFGRQLREFMESGRG